MNYTLSAKKENSGQYGLNSAKCVFWLNVVMGIENALTDLLKPSREAIYVNQRRTLFSVRFAMEGVADLLYLNGHPDKLNDIVTSKDFNEKLLDTNKAGESVEKDKEFAKVIRDENKLPGLTTDRISLAFPGKGLTQYALLCIFTHNNDLGNQFYVRKAEKEFLELYHLVIRSLRLIFVELAKYMIGEKNINVSRDGIGDLLEKITALERWLYVAIKP